MGRLDLMLLVTVLGAAQLFFTLLFFLKLRRETSPKWEPYSPPVSVILPCRDDSATLPAAVAALLAQDYEGRAEFIFTTADAADPAHQRLRELLAKDPGRRARLVVSEVKPVRCAAKLANLLGALPHAAADSEVLLFADSDLVVPRDWLRRMVAPLQD
ncbi:MAG: glycosyltransferase, partial [Elusimicrobia bacterium]|nr:glycosyltransferase [Elusimicrobiota bacterium]